MNLWSTPDRNNPAIEGAIHMIFLDETVCLEISYNTFIPILFVDLFFIGIVLSSRMVVFMLPLGKI
jgi:hypothetical protein